MSEDEEALADNPVLRTAVFGTQVEQFLETDVGRYLLQCAEVQVTECVEKLKKADAYEKPAEVALLQSKIREAENITGWLMDAVRAGLQAKVNLQENV